MAMIEKMSDEVLLKFKDDLFILKHPDNIYPSYMDPHEYEIDFNYLTRKRLQLISIGINCFVELI